MNTQSHSVTDPSEAKARNILHLDNFDVEPRTAEVLSIAVEVLRHCSHSGGIVRAALRIDHEGWVALTFSALEPDLGYVRWRYRGNSFEFEADTFLNDIEPVFPFAGSHCEPGYPLLAGDVERRIMTTVDGLNRLHAECPEYALCAFDELRQKRRAKKD